MAVSAFQDNTARVEDLMRAREALEGKVVHLEDRCHSLELQRNKAVHVLRAFRIGDEKILEVR